MPVAQELTLKSLSNESNMSSRILARSNFINFYQFLSDLLRNVKITKATKDATKMGRKVVIIDFSIIHFKCVIDNYAFKQRHIYDKSIGLGIDLNT